MRIFFLLLLGICTALHGQDREDLEKMLYDHDVYILDQINTDKILKTKIERLQTFIDPFYRDLNIAILGHSSDENNPLGFNSETLTTLLQLIKKDNPKAVFFNGNLVYSLLESQDLTNKGEILQLPVEKNIFGNSPPKVYGIFTDEAFKQALATFKSAVEKVLGTNIPFYPLMGVQEAIGQNTAEIFRQQFGLNNAVILDSNQLVYAIPIDNALFLAVSTDFYQKGHPQPTPRSLSPAALEWLQETLEKEGNKYPFRFVIGSSPAFSTTAVFNVFNGLDQDKAVRDQFWKMLIDHKVRGYFSGGELIYDRTYRFGVWQIITGGAGTPNANNNAFYHYVWLTVPQKSTEDPLIQVFDINGESRDTFEMTATAPILFNLRISMQPP